MPGGRYSQVRSFTLVERERTIERLFAEWGIDWNLLRHYTWDAGDPVNSPETQPEKVFDLSDYQRVEEDNFVAYFHESEGKYVLHESHGIVVTNVVPKSLIGSLVIRDKGNSGIDGIFRNWA